MINKYTLLCIIILSDIMSHFIEFFFYFRFLSTKILEKKLRPMRCGKKNQTPLFSVRYFGKIKKSHLPKKKISFLFVVKKYVSYLREKNMPHPLRVK